MIFFRFFAIQLLLVGTPSMIFIVYALHKITLLPIQDQGDQLPRQNLFSADCKYLELKKCTILLKVKRKTIKFMDLIFFFSF